ncbi:MAG: hypothetical protein WC511_01600 [Candidatus Pacearchaeota archaeon]
MWIELRVIEEPLNSHRVEKAVFLKHKTIYELDISPDNGEGFTFIGKDILKLAGKSEEASVKGYLVGVEKKDSLTEIHTIENFLEILTINKHTNFKLNDVVKKK